MGKFTRIDLSDSYRKECDYHAYRKNHKCYSRVSIDKDVYSDEDLVVIDDDLYGYSVCRIMCIFVTKDVQALVRKYLPANHLRVLYRKHRMDFDKKNEVVEDSTEDYVINISQIKHKCTLILLHQDDSPDFVSENGLDPLNNFVCRYTLKSQELVPVVDLLNDSVMDTEKSKKPQFESTPTSYVDNFKNDNNENGTDFSPPQRNSVRRNLNKSFGNSPEDNSKSILNYSIVNPVQDEGDVPLVLRLRTSHRSGSHGAVKETPKRKESLRRLPRKSYAEYLSPVKTSSKKNQNCRSTSDEESVSTYTPEIKTPSKRNKNCPSKSDEELAPSVKLIYSPEKRNDQKVKLSIYPDSRRLVKPTQRYGEDFVSPICSPRGARRKTFSESSKDKSVNLNDSLRTNLLKVNVTRLNVDEISRIVDSPSKGKSSGKENNRTESTSPRTPRSKRKPKQIDSSESESSFPTSPPKTPRTRSTLCKATTPKTPRARKSLAFKTSPKATPRTPRNVARLIREGILTPSMKERSKVIKCDGTPLMKARTQLHVSYVPKTLPCRENEYASVYDFLEGKLLDECGGCMYVSGVPGTGKTATVTSVIKDLLNNDRVPSFTFVSINGMKLTEPRQAYVQIYKQFTGKTVPWEQAQSMLEEMFVKSKKLKPVIMLVDELDILCTKRQDVVYNLLDWPAKAKNQLVVITIANTMDLPERLLMSRVTSRLGLTRLTFQPYTYKQLQEIVTKRLSGTDSFNPDAVQFVARKVASVSGDARRALDICRRAAEVAEQEGETQLVGMDHVNAALNMMITQPRVRAIRSCSRLQQLILQAIVAEVERTGIEETCFNDVYKMLVSCCAIDGFQMVSVTIALSAVAKLSACRLILTDAKCSDIYQRIILNVSIDDVYYALKKGN